MRRTIQFCASLLLLITSLIAHAERVPMYAMYDPNELDFFYTTNLSERNYVLTYTSYIDQGIAFYVEESSNSGAVPWYRFYKGAPQTEHFYTKDDADVQVVLGYGWGAEGNEGYVWNTQVVGSVPLYRFSYWVDATANLMHKYTTDANEIGPLQQQGWAYEGVKAYVFTRPGVADDFPATILAYHAGEVVGCNDYSSANIALERDLSMMANNGFTVVPLSWMVDWLMLRRDSRDMPSKPVSLTFDDGYDLDYLSFSHPACPNIKSAKQIMQEAQSLHPRLFAGRPLGTSFVIASPAARAYGLPYLHDSWWRDAKLEGILDIQNHSADHDNSAINQQVWEADPAFGGIPLPIGGLQDGDWRGHDNFCRIGMPGIYDPDGSNSAIREVIEASNYIARITGIPPIFFANPVGGLSSGLRNWWNTAQHGISAAFASSAAHVRRGAVAQYSIPRFLKGAGWNQGDWSSSEGALLAILNGGGRENPYAPPTAVSCR